MQRRARLVAALSLMLACAACGGLQTTSAASCLGPYIDDQPPSGDGHDMGFSTTVRIPAGTPAGTATVSDDQYYPETYKFEIGK